VCITVPKLAPHYSLPELYWFVSHTVETSICIGADFYRDVAKYSTVQSTILSDQGYSTKQFCTGSWHIEQTLLPRQKKSCEWPRALSGASDTTLNNTNPGISAALEIRTAVVNGIRQAKYQLAIKTVAANNTRDCFMYCNSSPNNYNYHKSWRQWLTWRNTQTTSNWIRKCRYLNYMTEITTRRRFSVDVV
jgi:hypothetical protein